MLPQHVLLALVAAVSAVPLNINLGAYSPALVVGDGEISFDKSESAAQLMETLATGAAANNGAANNEQQAAEGQKRDITSFPNLRIKRSPAPEPVDSLDMVQAATEWIKRDLAGFQEALNYAREAMKNQPKVELGTPNSGVGIQVNAGVDVPANSAANGAPATGQRAKRSEDVEEVTEESDTPKMTLVAITEV